MDAYTVRVATAPVPWWMLTRCVLRLPLSRNGCLLGARCHCSSSVMDAYSVRIATASVPWWMPTPCALPLLQSRDGCLLGARWGCQRTSLTVPLDNSASCVSGKLALFLLNDLHVRMNWCIVCRVCVISAFITHNRFGQKQNVYYKNTIYICMSWLFSEAPSLEKRIHTATWQVKLVFTSLFWTCSIIDTFS